MMRHEIIERIKAGRTLMSIQNELGLNYEIVKDCFYEYCNAMKKRPGWPSIPPRIRKVYFGHPKQHSSDEMDYAPEWKDVAFNELSHQEQVMYVSGL